MPPLATLLTKAVPAIAAGISGGASLLQNASQNRQIQRTNEQNRQFALDMYNMNRRDALADWQRQVDYQSPGQQMARFKEAGLSPHLIYGQMTNAPAVRTPEAPKHEAQTLQGLNIGDATKNALTSYISSQQAQADADLTKKRLEKDAADTEFVKANTLRVLQDMDLKKFGEERAKQLFPYTLGTAIHKQNLLSDQQQAQAFKNYADKTIFPKRLDLLMQQIAKTKSAITTDKVQRDLLEQQIKLMSTKNYYYGLSEGQKLQTGKILQESALLQNLIKGRTIQSADLDNELKRIKQNFKSLGLSESVTSDILSDFIKLLD